MYLDHDKKQTKKNARAFLLNAQRIRSIVESQSFIRSPIMSHSPVSHSNINPEAVAKMAIKTAEAKEEWEAINEAVNRMNEERGLMIAKMYLDKNKLSDTDLYLNMGLSSSAFYNRLDKALVEFAFCYQGGVLVAWVD